MQLPNQTHTLKNGLKVILVQYPSPGVIAYSLAVHAGSRNETEKGKSGFAHFFEHLMFRGTKHRTGKEFGELYAKLGNENNAWTNYDLTNYHGVVAADYIDKVLEAEADRFANLSFDEKQLQDEAGAVLGEYNKNISQPESVLEEKLMETAFKVHPYSHTVIGYKKDILDYPQRYKDVWPFFKRYYRPENVSLILVGDLQFSQTLLAVKKHFEKWVGEKVAPVEIPSEPEQNEFREAAVSIDTATQTRLVIAYKSPAFSTHDKNAAILTILPELLFSVTSDFQKEFVFEKNWIDSVYSYSPDSVDPSIWPIFLRFSNTGEAKIAEVKAAVEKEIEKLRKGKIDPTRLEQTKKRLRNSIVRSGFSSPDGLGYLIAIYTNLEGDIGVLDRMLGQLNAVSAGDIKAFANKYLIKTKQTNITLTGK